MIHCPSKFAFFIFCLFGLLFLFPNQSQAQGEEEKTLGNQGKSVKATVDTLVEKDELVYVIDTIIPEKKSKRIKNDSIQKPFLKRIFNDEKHSPKKAVILSAILPGTGQIYNRSYWKLPIVYGAMGTMGYFIYSGTKQHKKFKKAYFDRVDNDVLTIDTFPQYTDTNLKNLRDEARKNLELSYMGFTLAYVLVGVDAFVEAHLKSFDVSDDLTLQIKPKMLLQANQMTPGFSIVLKQKTKSNLYKPLF